MSDVWNSPNSSERGWTPWKWQAFPVIYSRSSEKGKCNHFLNTLGHFPLFLPSLRSLDTFLFGKVHCDILYHFLHLLIALAAPGVHFQDTLREGGLLAATPQLTASGKWQVLIDVLWALYFLYLSLKKKKKKVWWVSYPPRTYRF